MGCGCNSLRFRDRAEFGYLTGLGNVPVLTKLATEIAASGTERKYARSRKKVV
jgi:hypothetical protein